MSAMSDIYQQYSSHHLQHQLFAQNVPGLSAIHRQFSSNIAAISAI